MRVRIAPRSLTRCCSSGTFKSVVRAAYEERFVVSAKQKAGLDRWEKTDVAKLAKEDDGDVTTEEEDSDCYYESDD